MGENGVGVSAIGPHEAAYSGMVASTAAVASIRARGATAPSSDTVARTPSFAATHAETAAASLSEK